MASFDFQYDTLGNLNYRHDDVGAGVSEFACYDNLNCLSQYAARTGSTATACTSAANNKQVAYDALGNITSENRCWRLWLQCLRLFAAPCGGGDRGQCERRRQSGLFLRRERQYDCGRRADGDLHCLQHGVVDYARHHHRVADLRFRAHAHPDDGALGHHHLSQRSDQRRDGGETGRRVPPRLGTITSKRMATSWQRSSPAPPTRCATSWPII